MSDKIDVKEIVAPFATTINALKDVADDPGTSLKPHDAPKAASAVTERLDEKLTELQSRVDYATSQEPAWKSRAVNGTFLTYGGAIWAAYNLYADGLPNDFMDYAPHLAILWGGLVILWGRYGPKKPLWE